MALLSVSACNNLVQDVNPGNLPKVDKKLVVHGFISPQDTALVVIVGESRPVFGTSAGVRATLAGATVVLSEGTRTITLPFRLQEGHYSVSTRTFPIRAGQTYRLQVSAPTYQPVQAVCTVPQAIPIRSALLDSAVTNRIFTNQRDLVYYVRMTWQDPAGQTNYYRVAGDVAYPVDSSRSTAFSALSFGRGNALIADRNQDGQAITSPRGEFPAAVRPGQTRRSYTITAHLLHTDRIYYDYHTTVFRQDQTGGNPFAEPVLISGNIEGGLGCFGAFNRTTVTVTLQK
ncbi:hypothetical protein GCM10023187_17390 [Nibrella viscosa]|uniref:DUF4249 domain-containing protein n=2 Tax=Nibrella viscosa TaxID=1084524 RepID=A0ABP8K8N6_9BACT